VKRKAHTNPLDLTELKRLYYDEGWTLRAIAKRFDVTYQAVHDRVVRGGLKLRPRVTGRPPIGRTILERLYLNERLSVEEIAERLKTSKYYVKKSLRSHAFPRMTLAKRSELAKLSIGAAIELPKPKRRRFYAQIYGRAKNAGIRISIRTIDKDRIEVRRVD
jgi:predicted DNA-binding protein YlxM (UPF0122 family)